MYNLFVDSGNYTKIIGLELERLIELIFDIAQIYLEELSLAYQEIL